MMGLIPFFVNLVLTNHKTKKTKAYENTQFFGHIICYGFCQSFNSTNNTNLGLDNRQWLWGKPPIAWDHRQHVWQVTKRKRIYGRIFSL